MSLRPRRALTRAAIALGVAAAVGMVAPLRTNLKVLIAWDAFALSLSALAWSIILGSTPSRTQKRAGAEDPGRTIVAVVAIAASVFSLFSALLMIRDGRQAQTLAVLGVASAWLLTHTTFALRYAHLYYRDRSSVGGEGVGGVVFPGGAAPSDLDFAYFSFTIGICFQVSDVAVTSPQIRRTVLVHAVMSYFYSTVILALALNLVFANLLH